MSKLTASASFNHSHMFSFRINRNEYRHTYWLMATFDQSRLFYVPLVNLSQRAASSLQRRMSSLLTGFRQGVLAAVMTSLNRSRYANHEVWLGQAVPVFGAWLSDFGIFSPLINILILKGFFRFSMKYTAVQNCCAMIARAFIGGYCSLRYS